MANFVNVKKKNVQDALNNYDVYTNKYDAENKTNAVENVSPQWWGDEDRDLKIDLDTGIVWEVQDNGDLVGMGAFDSDGIKAIMKSDKNARDEGYPSTISDYNYQKEQDKKKNLSDKGYPSTKNDYNYQKEQDKKKNLSDKGYPSTKNDYNYQVNHPNEVKKEEQSVLKRTGATIAASTTSLVEGLVNFGETIADAGLIAVTAASTATAAVYDIIGGTIKGIQNKENIISSIKNRFTRGESFTQGLWETTKNVVSKDVSGYIFDSVYENGLGKSIKDNAYGFDTTRRVGNLIGDVVGIVAISAIATPAAGALVAGGSAAAGASAGAASASASVAPYVLGLLSGISGFGQGTENSWNNGAGIARGLTSGAVKGGVDAGLTMLGGKIYTSAMAPAARVGATSLIGTTSAFADPVSAAIGNNTSYETEFENAGGFKNVAERTITAGALSALGEIARARSTTYSQIPDEQNVNNNSLGIEDKQMAGSSEPVGIADKQATTGASDAAVTTSRAQTAGSSEPIGIADKQATTGASDATFNASRAQTTAGASDTASNASRTQTTTGASDTASTASRAQTTAGASDTASTASRTQTTTGASDTASTASRTQTTAGASGTRVNTDFVNHTVPDASVVDELQKYVNKRGLDNLSYARQTEIADVLNIPKDQVVNMSRSVRNNIVKQYHFDQINQTKIALNNALQNGGINSLNEGDISKIAFYYNTSSDAIRELSNNSIGRLIKTLDDRLSVADAVQSIVQTLYNQGNKGL